MDSQKKQAAVEENNLCKLFSELKSDLSKINDNKYFDLSKASSTSKAAFYCKKENKPQITMSEWFENLSVFERVEAVSTIFDKDNRFLEHIKASLYNLLRLSRGTENNF